MRKKWCKKFLRHKNKQAVKSEIALYPQFQTQEVQNPICKKPQVLLRTLPIPSNQLSYSCMNNTKQIIDHHNKHILNSSKHTNKSADNSNDIKS